MKSALIVSLLALASMLQAQSTGATLQGRIKDTTGAGVASAEVHVTNVQTGGAWNTTTDDTGRYRVPALPPGTYDLYVKADQFPPLSRKGLALAVGQDAILDLVLQAQNVTRSTKDETVISVSAESINLASGAVTGLVNDQQIRDLPLNGRSFQQLATLQPGVMVAYSSGNDVTGRTPKMSINGTRPDELQFLLDGTNVGNILGKTPGSVAGLLLGVDAVMEFRVMTSSYSAEYGRVGGGVINAATRWGGNDVHGSAFEFLRNSALDTKNYFDRSDEGIPPFKRNQYGGTLGGAIPKNRTFFFASYESLIERLGVPGLAFVPDAAARRGVIGTQTIPVNPASAKYMDALFPSANGPSLGNGAAEYFFSRTQPTDENFLMGRLDHRFSNGDLLFGRYTFDNGKVERVPGNKLPISDLHERNRNQYVTLEYQHLIMPSLLNGARLGFNRSTTESANDRNSEITPDLSFIPGQPFGFLSIGGIVTELGGDFRVPRADRWNSYQAEDSLMYLHGAHAVRFGLQVDRMLANQSSVMSQGGTVRFANLEGFLRGTPISADVTLPPGFLANDQSNWQRSFSQSLFSLYVQDDIRLHDRLMLNLGLRYQYATVPAEKYGRISLLETLADSSLTVGGKFYNNTSGDFAPRVGLAWDPFGKKTTAIRAGFGLFYDEMTQKYIYYGGSVNAPFLVRTTIANPSFPNILADFDPSKLRLTVQNIERSPSVPYVAQFNLSVQQVLPGGWDLSAAYVGSRGIHLMRHADANVAPWTVVNGVKVFQPQLGRLNPAFGAILERVTDARSYYNSLQLSLGRRVASGLSMRLNYTFSRSVDDASGLNIADFDNSVQFGIDFYDRLRDRGLSSFHAAQNLSMNWTADLPFGRNSSGAAAALLKGWQLNNVTTLQSGHPFTVTMSFNGSGNLNLGFMNERPNIKAGYTNNPVLGDPSRYWDINAFELPAANQMGTLGRNTLIGPGVVMMDLSASKPLISRERTKLLFRAEAFNFLNHPNFATPSGRTSFTSASGAVAPDWGRITSTVTSSRQIQLGLKLIF